ncbi:MAG: DUF2165 family protein [Pseudomonadales bacterium]
MIRIIKVVLMFSIAAWGVVGGFTNLIDYQGGVGVVALVLSMDLVMETEGMGPTPAAWRAITSPVIAHIGFFFIWASKLATGVLCAISAGRLWMNRAGKQFNDAKQLGLAGAGVSLFMLFFGFVTMSGTYFELYRDHEIGYSTHVIALVYFGMIGISSLLIAQDD